MTRLLSIVPKIIATRASIPFLCTSARTALKVDVNRHCAAMPLHRADTPVDVATCLINGPADLQGFKDTVNENAFSVVISWLDDSVGSPQTNDYLRTMEKMLRDSHREVTTTKPFFMLDGSGLRKASLSLLGKPNPRLYLDHTSSSSVESDYEVSETWLRHYCSLRSVSP